MPSPLKFFARLLIVSCLVMGAAHYLQRPLLQALSPLIRASFLFADNSFKVLALDIGEEGPNEVIRLRANLAQPINVGGRVFYPIGWGTRSVAWYQVTLTLGGALLYSLLALIVVLAWPASRWQSMLKRVAIALPLMLMLLLVNTTTTFAAELWAPIHEAWVPDITWPLLVWSRMLMGGVGLALGLLCGAMAIVLGASRVAEKNERTGCL